MATWTQAGDAPYSEIIDPKVRGHEEQMLAVSRFAVGKGTAPRWDFSHASDGVLRLNRPTRGPLYGMRGTALGKPVDPRLDIAQGMLRDHGAPVAAGAQ